MNKKKKHTKKRRHVTLKKIKLSPKTRRIIALAIALLLVIVVIRGISVVYKASNVPKVTSDSIDYEIRGVDVSSYQGTINWQTLANQNIAFAYIKATEGSSHVDSKFSTNWTNAQKTDLRLGAYHFMSYESSGETQAENFINTVPKTSNMLPPVIDVEYYGSYSAMNISQTTVDTVLEPLIKKIKSHYGMNPILYTTPSIYKRFIKGKYDNEIGRAHV